MPAEHTDPCGTRAHMRRERARVGRTEPSARKAAEYRKEGFRTQEIDSLVYVSKSYVLASKSLCMQTEAQVDMCCHAIGTWYQKQALYYCMLDCKRTAAVCLLQSCVSLD